MKKLSLYIFLFLLCFNFLNKANAIPKKGNGQGDLALSEDIIKDFHSYIVTRVNNNPLNFFITADHKNVFIEIRKNTTYRGVSGSGPIVRNKKKCEQKFKQECFLFANQRVIVWNNNINPIDSKKSKIKRKTSYDELIIKLSELGFIETKEQKAEKEKKLAEAKGTKEVTWQVFVKLTGEMGNNSNLPGFNAKETLKIKSIKDQVNVVKKVIDKALSKCENSNVKWTISLRGNKICTVTVVKYFDEENLNNNNKYVNLLGIKFDDLIITINGLENVTSEKIDEKVAEDKKLADEKAAEDKKLAEAKAVEGKKLAEAKAVEEKLVMKLSLIPAETDLEKAQNFLKNLKEIIKLYPDEFDIIKISEFFILTGPILDGDLNYKSKKDLEELKEFTKTSDLFVKYNNDIEKNKRVNKLNKINDAVSNLENNIKIIKGFLVTDPNSIYLKEWLNGVKNAELIIDNPSSYDQLLKTNDDLIRLKKSKNEIDEVIAELKNNIDELKEILKQNLTTDLAPLLLEQAKLLETVIKKQILKDMNLANQKFEEFIFKTIEEPKLKAAKEKKAVRDKKLAEEKILRDKKLAEEKILRDKQLAEEKILRDKQLAKEKILRDKQLAKEKISNEIKKWWKSF